MHILYLDDSGSVANADERYFVLAGVSVPEGSVRWLGYRLEELAIEVLPDDPRSVEFHASEIFGGRGPIWSRYRKRQQRIQWIKRVISVLQNAYASIRVFACAVHKESYPGKDPVELAFEDISSRFNHYLDRVSDDTDQALGMIVLDRSSYENSLQSLAYEFRRDGNRWGGQLRRLIEVPLFVDSQASRVIQLADHIAYAVFRYYNAEDLGYVNLLQGKFDEYGGVLHGLSHMQIGNRDCLCAGCISRRINASSRL